MFCAPRPPWVALAFAWACSLASQPACAGIGVSPDGRKVYTANGPSDDVSVTDVATGTVDRRIAVGGRPWGLVVSGR